MTRLPQLQALAITVARAGALPPGSDEAVAEAGGFALVVGDGAAAAAGSLQTAQAAWYADTGTGMRPGALAAALAPVLAGVPLLIMPGSADGRDLAPRLAHTLGRPLLANATAIHAGEAAVEADLLRLHGKLTVRGQVDGPAVATLLPGVAGYVAVAADRRAVPLDPPLVLGADTDAEVLEVLEPDPTTMDLAEARRVLGAGAGLLPTGADAATGQAVFGLLTRVASALGASAGATRVITDAGWTSYDRQIGTTGVAIDPELYIAFGISGAVQHTGGLGTPSHVVSINTDPSCPMTAMADLGIIADARGIYPRVLDDVIPRWWDEVPVQRWVTRRSTMIMTADQALTVDFRAPAWGQVPYNGMTAYRAEFDAWLAFLCSPTFDVDLEFSGSVS